MEGNLEQAIIWAVIGLVWMFVNLKAGSNWLKLVSIVIMMFCLGAATLMAVLGLIEGLL